MFSPLDQFKIAPLISITILSLDFSISTLLVTSLISVVGFYISLIFIRDKRSKSFFLVPNGYQIIIERLYEIVAELVADTISTGSDKYLPIMTFFFMFILVNNVIGLLPYSFSVTSHVAVTLLMSFSIFLATVWEGLEKYGLKMFGMFLPANTDISLAIFLVPLEFISYLVKPVSLGVRLFINLMAGHSLLKVIGTFSWNMLLAEKWDSVFMLFILPTILIALVFSLEIGVAFIQAYVFVTLTAIYLNDAESLH